MNEDVTSEDTLINALASSNEDHDRLAAELATVKRERDEARALQKHTLDNVKLWENAATDAQSDLATARQALETERAAVEALRGELAEARAAITPKISTVHPDHLEFLTHHCARLAVGECHSTECMRRGGWHPALEETPNYERATCPAFELETTQRHIDVMRAKNETLSANYASLLTCAQGLAERAALFQRVNPGWHDEKLDAALLAFRPFESATKKETEPKQ